MEGVLAKWIKKWIKKRIKKTACEKKRAIWMRICNTGAKVPKRLSKGFLITLSRFEMRSNQRVKFFLDLHGRSSVLSNLVLDASLW